MTPPLTPEAGAAGRPDHLSPWSIVPFLAITFGLAWGIVALFVLLPDRMAGLFGELTGEHPLFYLAAYAPAIAAILLVLHDGGTGGLRRFLARAALWRCSAAWYAFILLGIPLVFFAAAALQGDRVSVEVLRFSSIQSLLLALGLAAIKGPVEELGWRGFALPLMQRKLAPVWCSLVLGITWGVWHFPAFLLSGTPQGAWDFAPFLLGTIAVSVIITALYNQSRGSILLAALFHFQLINPLWPDAQPWDMYLFAAVAGLVLWATRRTMFSRAGASTTIIPLEERAR